MWKCNLIIKHHHDDNDIGATLGMGHLTPRSQMSRPQGGGVTSASHRTVMIFDGEDDDDDVSHRTDVTLGM